MRKRLSVNYYWKSKEWQYKNIEPRIIVEKRLLDSDGNIPMDYKLHVIHGKVRMIQVDMNWGTINHSRNWYNVEWQREPFNCTAPTKFGTFTNPSAYEVARSKNLDLLIELSEKLAESFIYVRADWFDLDGKLYFGELTFHHDSGHVPI